jgi:hypothetical protein
MDQESSLACDGVAFHYPDTKEPALHELTFSIPTPKKSWPLCGGEWAWSSRTPSSS